MPERVEFAKSGRVRDKQVAAIGEDRKDGTEDSFSVASGGEGFTSCTKLPDCSERGFGKY